MLLRQFFFGKGQDDLLLNQLLRGLRIGNGIPEIPADGLGSQFGQNVLALVGHELLVGLFHIVDIVDARGSQPHIPAQFFRQQPFVL